MSVVKSRGEMLIADLLLGLAIGLALGILGAMEGLQGTFAERFIAVRDGWLVIGLPNMAETIEIFTRIGVGVGLITWLYVTLKLVMRVEAPARQSSLVTPLPRWLATPTKIFVLFCLLYLILGLLFFMTSLH